MTNQEKLQIQIDSTTVEGKLRMLKSQKICMQNANYIYIDTSDMFKDGSFDGENCI